MIGRRDAKTIGFPEMETAVLCGWILSSRL